LLVMTSLFIFAEILIGEAVLVYSVRPTRKSALI
jgi:hypothetical protein